jgi:gliding motility-associated-like protein
MRKELRKKTRIGRITFLFVFWSFFALGEGTKEIMPAAADIYYLEFNRSGGQSTPFGVYTPNTYVYQPGTSALNYRINIRICNVGEIINFGFNSNNSNTYYRIRRPSDGTIVVGPNKIPSAAAAGYIASYAQAVAGPQTIVGATGYNNLSYTALETGDYYIEFNQGTGTASTTYQNNDFTLQYFDITVSSAANVAILGRLWSQTWQFTNVSSAYYGSFYVYSDDGIVTKLNSNGMQPYAFSISCNATGVTNTGNPAVDEKSVTGNSVYPQYKIFFNNPDINCFPTGSFGSVIGIPTITGCGSNRCINIQVSKAGNFNILLDLNGVPGYQPGTSDRQISAVAVAGMNCVPWNGLDGLGNPIAGGTIIKTQVSFLNGVTNFPLYDGEYNQNGYIVTLVRPAGPSPKLFWDDSNYIPSIYPASTALDGISNYTGCTMATGCHRWNGPRGNNACPPCSETSNTWWYANVDTISILYTNSTITVDANSNTPGTGYANNNFNACGTLTPIQLKGAITGPAGTTGQWSSNGSGSFSPNNTTLTGTYTPSAADITAGSVILKLASVSAICPAVLDSMIITLVPPPVVFAGVAKSACSNNPIVSLSDATKNATTSATIWSGGAGTYTPNKTTVNITYNPTAAELAAHSVTLTLTGIGNAVCANSTSSVTITYSTPPTANAGAAKTVCANNGTTTITGTVSAGATAAWTSSSGCVACFSSPGTATTNYTPSATDNTNGSVVLTLTASSAGCLSVTSTMTLTIKPAPIPNAGPNQSICKNKTIATLAGSTANATSSTWSSSSGCNACFSSLTSMTPTYTPSAGDISNGSVVLTLTSANTTFNCNNVSSSMTITYTNAPVVVAGPAQSVCVNNPSAQLAGSVTGPPGVTGVWTGGLGTFVPNNTTLNAVYTLSPIEVAGNFANLYLTSTNNGNCNPVKDSVTFSIVPIPNVNAGSNASVCRNNPTVNISGTVTGIYNGASWSSASSGAAGFGNPTNFNTTYTLNATDLANGSVVLTLSANSIVNTCAPTKSSITITVIPSPTASAGANQTNICYNPGTVSLNGFSSTGSGTWSGGAGTFTPNANTSNATYTSTAGERAGGVTLTYTTTGNGLCNAVSSSMTASFNPQITVNAGTPITVCANNPAATLNGSSPTTGTGVWSGGAGTYSPSATVLNAKYTPTAGEIASGSVTLTLTATGTGGCVAPTSTVLITITPAPVLSINGGAATANICADNPTANLTVTLPGSLGVIWSGGAGVYNPNNTSASIAYTATNAEILAGTVTMTATSTNNGICNAVTKQITISIAPAPTINAGANQVLCGSTASVNLNGTVTGSTGGIWTTSGTGSFGSTTSLNTTYTPSAADKSSGLVTLTLTSTGNGTCNAVSSQMNVTFTVVPTENAGPNITVCSNTLPVQLAGTGSPGTWSGGAGTYSPNNGSMTATYSPTAAEITAGSLTLTLTSNPSGACTQAKSNVTITIQPSPIANAGGNVTVCGNQNTVNLNGSVNAQATGGFWTTTGSGTIGNPTSLNTTYTPAASEKPGSVTLTLTTTGNGNCAPNSSNMVITISAPVTVSAGPNQTLCNDGTNKALNGTITGATGGIWSIVSGLGTINNPTNVGGATYTPNALDNIVTLMLTTTGNPAGCAAMTSNVTLTLSPKPTVTTGPNQTVCGDVASVSLTGTVTNASGGIWTTTGAGTFSPNSTTINTSYIPAANETGTFMFTLTSTGNGICAGVYSSTTNVTITPKPTINAGADQSVCKNNSAITLTGTVTVATGGTWTTLGDGSFTGVSGNGLTATYHPGPNDISNGSVNLRLTSTGNGTCNAVSDMMVLTITPSPTINAGPDRTVCANNANIVLAGTETIATGGKWSSLGSGTFSGTSANGLNTTYTPSNADTSSHLVQLVLTSTGNGTCSPVTDTMNLTITPAPIVIAGPNQIICADSFYVKLNSKLIHALAGIWTTSGTGSFFNSNATYDTAVYVPSPADRSSGNVTLTYTTTVQGACTPVSNSLTLTITTAPTVTAGPNQSICSDGTLINVSGSKNSVSTGIIWTTSGNGIFGANTSLNTTYTPSAIDKAAGTVVLTLTSTGNGTCKPAISQLNLTIVPKPAINLGLPLTVCADVYNSGIQLNPTVANASSVSWVSSGGGSFGPTNTTQNAIYYPSIADTTSKSVTLTLTANGNTPCTSTSSSIGITINPIPIVNAGPNVQVCEGSNVNLNGSVLHASGGVWTTSGSGTFAPDPHTLNATYIPSSADTSAGNITLTLTSTGMGTCMPVSSQMTITFNKKPIANAGSNFTICADAQSYMVNGQVTNATSGVWSSSSGGNFYPPNGLNTMYYVTSQDSLHGQVVLTLTTIGSGACPSASSNIILTINPIPTINAGPPTLTVCLSANSIDLNGTVTNATGGFWASQGDGSFNNPDTLNTTYTFGVTDKANQTVLITLISEGNGVCRFYTDSIRINFTAITAVNAGPNRTICTTDFPIQLQGSGSNGQWTGGTASQYSNSSSLTSTYSPTAAEVLAGTLTLTLTSTSACPGPPSDVTFTFIPGPSITINPLTTICTNVNTINLTGTASSPGNWSSTGSGSFANPANINTTYTPSARDKTAGLIKFIYTIPAGGNCNAIQDTASIHINPTPTVNAGPDQTVCANALTPVTMNGSYTIAGGVQWSTTNGTGTITNPTSANAIYNVAAGDIPLTPIQVIIQSTGNGFCSVQTDTMLIKITNAPTANIGADTTMCANKTAQLTAVTTIATGGTWSTSGSGIFSPNVTSKTVIYTPSAADTAAGTVTVNYVTTGNGICNAVNVSKIIAMTKDPVVNAGPDGTICSGQDSVILNAAYVENAPSFLWTTTGTGRFSPNNTSMNAYYVPSAQDRSNGGVIIRLASTGVVVCDSVFDYKSLIIIPSPVAVVSAGFNQTICKDQTFAQLNGFIFIATAAQWSCHGAPCTGTFLPNDTDLNAQYFPSATDQSNGSVVLRLTTTAGNGICTPVFAEMTLTIINIPVVNAGNPQTVCADTASIQLNGSVFEPALVPYGYSWVSSGTGYFAPNSFVSNPTYIPDSTDLSNGQVSFTLTSTNNGPCQAYSNTVIVTITKKPTISAGIDKSTCANVASVPVIGTMTVATGANWTSSGTGTVTLTSGNGLTASYAPSAVDDTAGTVVLTIKTTAGLGSCKPVSDQMILTINPAPIVNAGVDRTICADNGNIAITGTISNATGGLWTSLGSGSFVSNTSLNTTYKPSSADTSNHSVKLKLTSTGNGLCLPSSDTLILTIVPEPVVNAGTAVICYVQNGTVLNGTIANALGGIWSTNGTGAFAVNASTLNATYYPSAADVAAGSVVLTLTSTGNGTCNPEISNTNLSITPMPVANAGPDQFVCLNSTTIISAMLSPVGVRYQWSRYSGAIVNPNITSLNVVANKDTAFILTVFDAKNCASANDTIQIRTFQLPAISTTGNTCLTDSSVINSNTVPASVVPGIYQWYKNNSIMSGQNTPTLHPNATGSYMLSYSYGGCSSSSNPPFNLNPSPIMGAINKTNCANNSTTLQTSNVNGGSVFTYSWTPNPTIIGATNQSQVVVTTNLAFDTLSYNVKVTNEFACFTSDSVYLISVAKPIFTMTNDTLCQNQVTTLSANPSNFGVGTIPAIEAYFPTYVWTRDGVNLNNNSKTQLVTTAGKYIVSVTLGDCNNNGDTSNVLYNKLPIVNLPTQTIFCLETDSFAVLNATAQPQAGYTFTYSWTPTGATTPILHANQAGEYIVTVSSNIGTNSCPITDSINVKNLCPPRVFVPNSFTPDKIGQNSTFRIFGEHYTNFKIDIFNRWGEVIFSSADLAFMQNTGWDGTYKEKPMPLGVYTYIIYYDGEASEFAGPYRKEGELLLLR